MSEQLEEQECILFKINRCRGLRGSKAIQFVLAIKVEFGNTILGESGKYECDAESSSLSFDFSCQMNVSAAEPLIFNEIAQTPAVITFTEILPKDKKARDEKTIVIGQTCIDLLPLLKGETIFTVVESIHPVSGIVNDPTHTLPEVEIEISTLKPLLNEEKLDCSNLLTICIESAFSLPEAWALNGNSYNYTACMPIPTEENDSNLVIPNGLYKAGGEKEISKQRKWSFVASASGSCLFIPDTEIHHSPYENEDGDLNDPEDSNFRDEAENLKPRITWNAEGRCFMFLKAINNLQQQISQYRYWPVEIIRTSVTNGKLKNKEEDSPLSYHGIVYVDLAPLLYPGVNKVRGAFYVYPFNETALQEKLNRKSCLDEKVMRRLMGSNLSLNQNGNTKAVGGKQTKTETRGKQSEGNLKGDGHDTEIFEVATQESHEYLEARTYMTLEIELEKPLVEKRQPDAVALRLAELIPPRAPYRMKQCGSKKAIEDFEKQISNTANVILEEFRLMFGSKLSENGGNAEERRKAFMYELNQSGKYFAFKEQLKYYVIKLVREKFMYTSSFNSQEEFHEFISKLYQFLIDRMHTGLNKFLSAEETTEVPPKIADSGLLKHFAKEAEIMFCYDIAAKYYQERIVRYKADAECWFDYGIHCLLVEDLQKAEECFKEVVSLDQQHMNGILLAGLMYFQHQEYSITEEFFDGVTCIHPKEVLPWTLLGLFYSGVENIIMAERSFSLATKLILSQVADENSDERDDSDKLGTSDEVKYDLSEKKVEDEIDEISNQIDEISLSGKEEGEKEVEQVKEHPSIFLYTAQFLLECHVLPMAERALAHELVAKTHGSKVLYLELLAQLKMKQKNYLSALESLEDALVINHNNQGAWALKGHIYYEKGDFNAAKQAYERCLAYCNDAPNIHSIYLRLATIYLEKDLQYEGAKSIFLKLCKSSPSCVTWLGMGVACYRLNQLFDAEQAFNEANILDNRNPDVWAYLSMVCLKEDRHLEAEQCYKYAVKVGPSKKLIMDEVMRVMIETHFDTSVL